MNATSLHRLRTWHAIVRRAPGRRGFDDERRQGATAAMPFDPDGAAAVRVAFGGVAAYAAWMADIAPVSLTVAGFDSLRRDLGELRHLLDQLDQSLEALRMECEAESGESLTVKSTMRKG